MSRTTELKLRLADCDEYQRICALAAPLSTQPVKTFTYSDMYFVTRTPNKTRMKLRTQFDYGTAVSSELIVYARPGATDARVSAYTRLEMVPTPTSQNLLEQAFGPCEVAVTKTRTVFVTDHVRIHLDFVQELGYFLEFEAMLDEQRDVHSCIAGLRGALGVAEIPHEPRSYREMLLHR